MKVIMQLLVLLFSCSLAWAADDVRKLPAPDTKSGKPLMTCLALRHADRNLGHEDLDMQSLGDLLWAAWGVNRRDSGKHVIPTGRDKRQVGVYAVRGDGVWRYRPEDHSIVRVLEGDKRGQFDGSGLVLLYIAPKDDPFAAMHVGSMYQNVGLYSASAGLANCVKFQKHDVLDAVLPLPKGWKTYITHSVAHPAR